MSDGTVRCWGYADDRDVPYAVIAVPSLAGSLSYTSVSVGGKHACATVSDGSLRCWGRHGASAVGFPQTSTGGSVAIDSSGNGPSGWSGPPPPAGLRWESVAAGQFHTCAVAAFLNVSRIICWGNEVVHGSRHPTHRHGQNRARLPTVGAYHHCWLHSSTDRVSCQGPNAFGASKWTDKVL